MKVSLDPSPYNTMIKYDRIVVNTFIIPLFLLDRTLATDSRRGFLASERERYVNENELIVMIMIKTLSDD